MELLSEEIQRIKTQLEEWQRAPEIELEATFGRFYNKPGAAPGKGPQFFSGVDLQTFLRVASRLKSKGLELIPQESYITVSLNTEGIRFRLSGENVVAQYCRDNRMAGKPFTAMIKDSNMTEEAMKVSNTSLQEYDLRIKMRREKELGHGDEKVLAALARWNEKPKYFRIIRRWSCQFNGIKYELSLVRSTPYNRKTGKAQAFSFNEPGHNLLNVDPTYEIECEIVHGAFENTDAAYKALMGAIGDILRGIQNTTMLIRKSTKEMVLRNYRDLTGIRGLEFRGVPPVTLVLKNMTVDPSLDDRGSPMPNIRKGYNVTDKADGLRVLGITDSEGELFMIDMAFNVYKTNLKKESCKNALLDGEYVTRNKANKMIQQLLFFDIYIAADKTPVDKKPFGKPGEDGRYDELQNWIKAWEADGGPDKLLRKVDLTVGVKTFFFADDKNDIFKQNKAMLTLAKAGQYHTDGLILTPNDLPLPNQGETFFEQFKWKPAKDNTVDFLGVYEKDEDDDKRDKIKDAIHPGTKADVRFKTMRLFVSTRDSGPENPREIVLNMLPLPKFDARRGDGFRAKLFSPTDFPDSMANVCYIPVQRDEQTGQEVSYTESEEPIRDRSIVEMRYDPKQPPGWRWIPLRIRADKTERFLKGTIRGTLNGERTAESIWNSIHEPVTEYMITTGAEAPSALEKAEMFGAQEEAEKTAKVLQRKYFERKPMSNDQVKVKNLRLFHRLFIKEEILYPIVFSGSSGKKLLDLAVGEGQDLPRWISGKAGFVLGLDYAGESILKPDGGAYARLLKTMEEAKRKHTEASLPAILFAIADSSKRIIDGSAGTEELDRAMLRSVFGNQTAADVEPPLVEQRGRGKLAVGADAVLCMFALHYFFANKETFDGLLRNISETLAIGGYFVGCNFDGQKVFDFLRGKKMGESILGQDATSTLWEITKEYEADELPTDDSAFGMAIDVEFISIGSKHREWLVPFELLKAKMATIGCELVGQKELEAIGLKGYKESTSLFDTAYEKIPKASKKKFEMSDAVSKFSFLNRWYVFKRTSRGQGEEAKAAVAALVSEEDAELAALAAASEGGPTATEFMSSVVPGGPAAAAQMTAQIAAAEAIGNMEEAARLKAKVEAEVEESKEFVPALRTEAGKNGVYAKDQLFKFSENAVTTKPDYLVLPEKFQKGARRHLAPGIPFSIRDTTDPSDLTVYPSITHFLAGMKFKYASKQPDLALTQFSVDGLVHKEIAAQRASKGKLGEKADHDLLMKELKNVALKEKELLGDTGRVGFDESRWLLKADELLTAAIQQRLAKDTWFCAIIAAALEQKKKLVYENPENLVLGAKVSVAGKITGANTYASRIEQVASAMPQAKLRACLSA